MVSVIEDDEFALPTARPFEDVAPSGPAAQPQRLTARSEGAAAFEQMTIDGSAPVPVRGQLPLPTSVTYPSRTNGRGHVVTIIEWHNEAGDIEVGVLCVCEAVRDLRRRPIGCWAMQDVRRWLGLPDPVAPEGV